MSWWFKRNPELLASECDKLGRNGNYKELFRQRGQILVSHGEIILRLRKTKKCPIAIIYPESTPYELPRVVLLKERLPEELVVDLSKKSSFNAIQALKPYVELYNFWHQNTDGSLCLLEQDNLETYGEFFNIHDVINRTRDWLAGQITGKLPPDSPEVELYAHFRNRNDNYEALIPESFQFPELVQGDFFCSLVSSVHPFHGGQIRQIYLGILLNGFNKSGIRIEPMQNSIGLQYMPDGIDTPIDIIEKRPLLADAIEKEFMLEGYWWHVDKTIPLIQDIFGIARVIGDEDENAGFKRIKKVIGDGINTLPDRITLGLRFLNNRREFQWQCFFLQKAEVKHHYIIGSQDLEDYKNLFRNYTLIAFSTSVYSENRYHLRNKGLCDHSELKSKTVAVVGCGALGGEVADILAKAGVGTLELTDFGRLEINNSIRHVLGIDKNGMSKVHGLAQHLAYHNFFISIVPNIANVFNTEIEYYYKESDIGISTIANDNTEGYINEQAIISNKVMFYARALRGGKFGRIFRVIPGQDACFYCLSLYSDENSELFTNIPNDPELPTITNECNNPIRPASAAELKLISSITARILLDHLQKGESDSNHWIWTTEANQDYLPEGQAPYSLYSSRIPPHRRCPYCNSPERLEVHIESKVLDLMRAEIEKAKDLETGGVLLGNIEKDILHIKHASGPGPDAKKTPTYFLKDKKYCQEFIDEVHIKNEQDSLYIGEWHYHPSKNNNPSKTDLMSLKDIATSSGYLTENPVMIIISNDAKYSVTVHPIKNAYYYAKSIIK